MRLIFLDEEFKLITKLSVRYLNLQWNRSYYDAGTFSIQVLKDDYSVGAKYVYNYDRPELGVIDRVQGSYVGDKKTINLSGFFAENILNDKIIYPTYFASGSIIQSVYDCVNTFKDDIPIIPINEPNSLGDETDRWQATGDNLGYKISDVLKSIYNSYRISYNYVENELYFETYEGKDRTYDNTDGNNFVVFSQNYKSVEKTTYDIDSSNKKNYFVIGGSGEGTERIYVTLDLSNGEYKKEQFIDARNLTYEPEEQTLEEYKNSLIQYGKEKSLDYVEISAIDVIPKTQPYQYLEDYDLGDKVEIRIEDLEMILEARIIEVKEVVKNGKSTVSLVIGEKRLTTLKKARI